MFIIVVLNSWLMIPTSLSYPGLVRMLALSLETLLYAFSMTGEFIFFVRADIIDWAKETVTSKFLVKEGGRETSCSPMIRHVLVSLCP